jgi:hypothetical protein
VTCKCGRHFCGFCLLGLAGDAHAHVVNCLLNPQPGNPYCEAATWERVQVERRRGLVQAKLANASGRVREKTLQLLRRELADLHIAL